MNTSFSSQVAEQAVHWLIESQGEDFDQAQQQALQQWLLAENCSDWWLQQKMQSYSVVVATRRGG